MWATSGIMTLPQRLALLTPAHIHRNRWPTSPEYAANEKVMTLRTGTGANLIVLG